MFQNKPDAVILHISDLHFGPYLQGVSRVGEWSRIAAPHDFLLVLGLEEKLLPIIREYRDKLIISVTGDLTTAAEPPAYEVVNNYLRDHPFISDILHCGLTLQDIKDRLFFVPGNHDIWLHGRLFTRWKRYADRREEYEKYFHPQPPDVYPLVVNSIPLTIYTIDSNHVSGFNPFNFRNVTGGGRVGRNQMRDLRSLYASLSNSAASGVDTRDGYNYEDSLKICLMHHHLQRPDDVPLDLEQRLLELEDAEEVINLLASIGVQIVLCGHQHFPYQKTIKCSGPNNPSILLSCAGTATQIDSKVNSFYVYGIKQVSTSYQLEVLKYTSRVKDGTYKFTTPQIPPSKPLIYTIDQN